MLDEQSVQLSRRGVARLDRPHLQNVAGFLEPGEPRAKYDPDSARSGLAAEMDRLAPHCLRHFHALLFERFSETGCLDPSFNPFANRRREAGESARFLPSLTRACESRFRSDYRLPSFFLCFWQEEIGGASAGQTNQHLGLLQRANRHPLGSRRQNDDAFERTALH